MIEHRIIPAKNRAFIAIKQSPDLTAFIQAAKNFIQDPDYTAELDRLCDFSQADLSHITNEDFGKFVEFALTEISLAPTARVALVAPSPEKRGIFEQFAGQMKAGKFQIFDEPEDAMMWLQE